MKYLKHTYWLLPFLLIIPQVIYTFHSMNQIRLEEAIESFRSVWFFENRLVWNGSYSNLGWAAIQSLIYHIFGFHFFTGKYIKLIIEAVSFLSLSYILVKILGVKPLKYIPVFVLITLSPTLLYFNSLQMPHGLDVSFFLICVFLLLNLDFKKSTIVSFLKQIILWILAMFAWMTYGGFVFYLPILGLIYLYKIYTQKSKISKRFRIINIAVSLCAFLLPLLLIFFYIDNRNVLINDPLSHKGIFRSYGTFGLNPEIIVSNLRFLYSDLFINNSSYYFEVTKTEFSDRYPVLTVLTVILVAVLICLKDKKKRPLILFLTMAFIFSFMLIILTGPKSLGGIRRGTILLVIFYGFYTLAWDYLVRDFRKISWIRGICLSILLLLPLHHILVYPINLKLIEIRGNFRETWWFESEANPDKIFNSLLNQLQITDVILPCLGTDLENGYCKGLSIIYPPLALACKHNNLKCNNVYTFDPRFDAPTKVDINYWGKGTHVEP